MEREYNLAVAEGGRQLRGISGRQAVRAFQRLGYERRRGKGSHVNLVKPGGLRLTLPLHQEISVGLLLHELRKAGITVQEFLDAL